MSKEMYIDICDELIEQGYTEDQAADMAYDLMVDRLADMADHYNDLRKEGM